MAAVMGAQVVGMNAAKARRVEVKESLDCRSRSSMAHMYLRLEGEVAALLKNLATTAERLRGVVC